LHTEKVLNALKAKPRISFSELMAETGIPKNTLTALIFWLRDSQLVTTPGGGRGFYEITALGEEALKYHKKGELKGGR
jgi:DNA-binding IclR family transcriptional regulator